MITCGGCTNTWSGQGRAHCSACHRTFSTVAMFDRHRDQRGDHGRCLDPLQVRDRRGNRRLFLRNRLWSGPEMPNDQRLILFGGAT